MITNSIHILLPVLVLLLSLFCYKADGKRMTNFMYTWPVVIAGVSSIHLCYY